MREKTFNQSCRVLQWREAVLRGMMDCRRCCQRRISRNKSLYKFALSVKQKKGTVEAYKRTEMY